MEPSVKLRTEIMKIYLARERQVVLSTRILTGLSGLACVGLNLKPTRFKPGSVSATRIFRQMRVYFKKATSSILKRTNC